MQMLSARSSNMKLLSQEYVKTTADKISEERKTRIAKLNDEEVKVTKEFNQLKTFVEVDRKKIADEFIMFKQETEAKRKSLIQEVESLEYRKKEALKPLIAIRKEAEQRISNIEKREKELTATKIELDEARDNLVDWAEAVKEREDNISVKECGLAKRAERIADEEYRLGESTKKLSKNWVEFHATIHSANVDLQRRETAIVANRNAAEAFRESLDQEAKRLENERIAIKDGYIALAKAKKEILGHA